MLNVRVKAWYLRPALRQHQRMVLLRQRLRWQTPRRGPLCWPMAALLISHLKTGPL